ncbi:MAG: hypothetical protein HN368_02690, partial [Spirochaetales bacterium]|nr:hypothetical protein [Spirochaetales bacterium]
PLSAYNTVNRELFEYNPAKDIQLEANDRIIIPGKQYFVTVTGAVEVQGSYPFVPDRRYGYYLNLAGGIDPGEDSNNIIITTASGGERGTDALVQPEDNIYIIPAQVTVSGAVENPGAYPYFPNQRYGYYLILAGGIDPGPESPSVIIVDRTGIERTSADAIKPNDNIHLAPTQITISGAVVAPGIYSHVPNRTWSYFVNLAGGFAPGGSEDKIEISGVGGELRDLSAPIRPDDNIFIAPSQVILSGAALNPGVYPYTPNRTWRYYANSAGGTAAGSTEEDVNITDIEGNLRDTRDTIRPDDSIHIAVSQVSVTGAVTNPGVYPFVPNRTWNYFVSIAGGISVGGTAEGVIIADQTGIIREKADFVQPDDNIQIDFAQVTVSGAVFAPGSVPYSPGRTSQYYIGLAGGFDQERNRNGDVTISDAEGASKWDDDIIVPGDRIYARNNSFLYSFNTFFPVITSGVAFITTIINLIDLLSR